MSCPVPSPPTPHCHLLVFTPGLLLPCSLYLFFIHPFQAWLFSVAQASLELMIPLPQLLRVLGLLVCTTTILGFHVFVECPLIVELPYLCLTQLSALIWQALQVAPSQQLAFSFSVTVSFQLQADIQLCF